MKALLALLASLMPVSVDLCILHPDHSDRRKDIRLQFFFFSLPLAAGAFLQQHVLWSAQLQQAEASGGLIGWGK